MVLKISTVKNGSIPDQLELQSEQYYCPINPTADVRARRLRREEDVLDQGWRQ